jgi:hypothetical protein
VKWLVSLLVSLQAPGQPRTNLRAAKVGYGWARTLAGDRQLLVVTLLVSLLVNLQATGIAQDKTFTKKRAAHVGYSEARRSLAGDH